MAKRRPHEQSDDLDADTAAKGATWTERLPLPTAHFRRRAWREFQRALDPLAPPRPLPRPRH